MRTTTDALTDRHDDPLVVGIDPGVFSAGG